MARCEDGYVSGCSLFETRRVIVHRSLFDMTEGVNGNHLTGWIVKQQQCPSLFAPTRSIGEVKRQMESFSLCKVSSKLQPANDECLP